MGTTSGYQRQLPRGRHKLSPEAVTASQRGRIFKALATAVAEKGFANTTVADIISGAGVSRETFYEQFSSKLDCFTAGFEHAVNELFSTVLSSVPSDRSVAEQFDHAFGAYLDAISAQPELAYLCMIEVYAAGPEMVRRRVEIQQRFADGIWVLLGAKDTESRFACEALVAAVSSMVTSRLAVGNVRGIRRLKGPFGVLIRTFLAQVA